MRQSRLFLTDASLHPSQRKAQRWATESFSLGMQSRGLWRKRSHLSKRRNDDEDDESNESVGDQDRGRLLGLALEPYIDRTRLTPELAVSVSTTRTASEGSP